MLPFNTTLEAANALTIFGGNIFGGGGPPEEDPPPHPRAAKTLAVTSITATNRDIHWKQRFLGLILAIWVRFHRILLRPFVCLGLFVAAHLVIQTFHLLVRFSDFLGQAQFLLRQLIHLKTLVGASQLVMCGFVQRIRSHGHAQVFDSLLRIFMHREVCKTHLRLNFIRVELVCPLIVCECPVRC